MKELTKNEENLLITIFKLKDQAYGVSIKKFLLEKTGKTWNYGTLYHALDQLVKRTYLKKSESDPTPARGGRRKIYYEITSKGLEALRNSLIQYQNIWGELSESLLEGSS